MLGKVFQPALLRQPAFVKASRLSVQVRTLATVQTHAPRQNAEYAPRKPTEISRDRATFTIKVRLPC